MTRIRHIPNFYKLLHEMETPKEYELSPFESKYKYGLGDIQEGDPRLTKIRQLLGIKSSSNSSKNRKIERESIDFEKLKIAKEVSGFTYGDLGTLLGMSMSTFQYRMAYGAFNDDELRLLEETLKLDEGALVRDGQTV